MWNFCAAISNPSDPKSIIPFENLAVPGHQFCCGNYSKNCWMSRVKWPQFFMKSIKSVVFPQSEDGFDSLQNNFPLRYHPFETSANFHDFLPLPFPVGKFDQFSTPPPLKNGWSLISDSNIQFCFIVAQSGYYFVLVST